MTEIIPQMTDELRLLMTDSRSQFTAEDKLCAVMAYLVTGGNSTKAAEMSAVADLKPATIRQWKKRGNWWPEAEAHAKALLQKDLERSYTKMLHRTEAEIFDRVEKGDVVIAKDGSQVRKPMTGKDLIYVHGVIHDKRAMIRGEPTSRTEKIDPMKVVNDLAKVLHDQGEASQAEAKKDDGWDSIPAQELDPGRAGHGKPH
jgi:transposase-like protein